MMELYKIIISILFLANHLTTVSGEPCATDMVSMVVYHDANCTQIDEAETKKSGHVLNENIKFHKFFVK